MSTPSRSCKVWAWPISPAVLTTLGLVSGLISDGAWDAVSWLAPVVPFLASAQRFRRSPSRP